MLRVYTYIYIMRITHTYIYIYYTGYIGNSTQHNIYIYTSLLCSSLPPGSVRQLLAVVYHDPGPCQVTEILA